MGGGVHEGKLDPAWRVGWGEKQIQRQELKSQLQVPGSLIGTGIPTWSGSQPGVSLVLLSSDSGPLLLERETGSVLTEITQGIEGGKI